MLTGVSRAVWAALRGFRSPSGHGALGRAVASSAPDATGAAAQATPTPASQAIIPYSAFFDTDLIQSSLADTVRSIPSVVDGLKPSQRKVLYACFKRNLRTEMKVAQLSGS